MKKKGLIIVPSHNAVGMFRLANPTEYIINNYSDEIDLEYCYMDELPVGDEVDYNYDFIHAHATGLLSDEFSVQLIKEKKRGVKIILDIDDYWKIPKHNPAHDNTGNKLELRVPRALEWCDGVTTTTKLFADEIRKFNKNVCILPNIIFNPSKSTPSTQKRLRIGVLCGSSHHEDLKLLGDMVKDLKEYQDKIQWVLCGFDTRGNSNPELSVWNCFEQILTDDYSIIDDEYKKVLLNYTEGYYPDTNKNYIRRWSLPMSEYATLYDNLDVLLAPLKNDTFNCMKSELKALEAGTYGKVLICSEVGIYKKLFTHDVNCLMVSPYRNNVEWVKHIKKLINHPEEIDRLKNNLSNKIKKDYNQDVVTKKRIDFYNSI